MPNKYSINNFFYQTNMFLSFQFVWSSDSFIFTQRKNIYIRHVQT